MASELSEDVMAQLRGLDLERGRPLIAVDADEVLVVFVDHLSTFVRGLGYEMRLVRYELEGSFFPIGSSEPIPFQACLDLIDQFFRSEAVQQRAVPGAATTLSALSRIAQIVVLTNAPRHATDARRTNLDNLGIPYQMVVNSGGKGRAMAWLSEQVDAPVAFIDDSVKQVESVANHAPDTLRLHFAWADFIHRIFPTCAHASTQVRSWEEAHAYLTMHLGANDG